MAAWLWLVPLLPLAGSVVLIATSGLLARPVVSAVGVGSVGLSMLAAAAAAAGYFSGGGEPLAASLGTWMAVGGFAPDFGLVLDALGLVMTLVVTIVGFLIHWYSTEYMAEDESYARFFACMNLFMAAMLTLVLADNLVLLYVGWEGVGLCSYLLIGFWYRNPDNGYAARKAFVMTRAGDAAMLIGLLLLATSLGTLEIGALTARAAETWAPGSAVATAAAALLLAGALGKSAQLPLQTWLPDAMAGPTPVSALIHAATMVTAGVYLIARLHVLFALAPAVQAVVAALGALTLLGAAAAALGQTDIKRILAYSTMSQIGYMFLALGVGAWSAAVFHFMTHAFFKALLFLAAGALILALNHEQDIFKMGGLRRRLPFVFGAFVIGGAALAAVPLVTSGFYSKEQILTAAWAAGRGGTVLWLAGVAAALLTSMYIFRAIFVVFYGTAARRPIAEPRRAAVVVPLAALSVLSLVGGFVETPAILGGVERFSTLLEPVLPRLAHAARPATELALALAAAAASLGGIGVAWLVFARAERAAKRPIGVMASETLASGFGVDALYDLVVVRPFGALARALRADEIDRVYAGVAALLRGAWRATASTQTGQLRWYAASMLAGLILVLAVTVLG